MFSFNTYSFSHSHILSRHMNIHTGDKTHMCDICGRCFRDVSSFKRHLNIHLRRLLEYKDLIAVPAGHSLQDITHFLKSNADLFSTTEIPPGRSKARTSKPAKCAVQIVPSAPVDIVATADSSLITLPPNATWAPQWLIIKCYYCDLQTIGYCIAHANTLHIHAWSLQSHTSIILCIYCHIHIVDKVYLRQQKHTLARARAVQPYEALNVTFAFRTITSLSTNALLSLL